MMSLVRARKAGGVTLTLPEHLAAALRVEQGGYVDAQQVEGGVLLKPLSPEERRKSALERIRGLQAQVRPGKETSKLSSAEQEDAIAEMLKDDDA